MAINTKDTYLMYKTTEGGTYQKVCDITSYPDVLQPPPRLDATTLSHSQHIYAKDISDAPELTFGALYNPDEYAAVKALEGNDYWYQLQFGVDGVDGVFSWIGDIFMTPKGGKVGALREAEITCYNATDIT